MIKLILCRWCRHDVRVEDGKTSWHDCFVNYSEEDWVALGVRPESVFKK